MKKLLIIVIAVSISFPAFSGTWQKVCTSAPFAGPLINSMSEVKNNRMYIGTWGNDAGVFRIDVGAGSPTYTSLWAKRDFMNFKIDPNDDNILYGPNWDTKMYKMTGVTGGTFSQTSTNGNSLPTAAHHVEVDRTNSQNVILATYDGLFRSTNGGASWASQISPQGFLQVEQSPWNPDEFYCVCQNWNNGVSFGGIYRYTWSTNTIVYLGLMGQMTRWLDFDADNPGKFYTFNWNGGVNYYNGTTFVAKATVPNETTDGRQILFTKCSGSAELYAGGGNLKAYRSTDGAASWQLFTDGLPVGIMTLAEDKANNYLYAGTSSGLYRVYIGAVSTPVPTATPLPPTPTFTPAIVPPTPVTCGPGSSIGTSWQLVTNNAAFGNRMFGQALSYNGYLWLMYGSNGVYPHYHDVWKSTDAANWQLVTSSPAPSERAVIGAVVFNNRMYISAGNSDGTYLNDVWWSTDGANWITATAAAAFPVRDQHVMTVFKGKMWVIAGVPSGVVGAPRLHDAWYSSDGTTWIQATANAAFSGRGGCEVIVYNDGYGEKMWLIGGHDGTNFLSDVWSSLDGVTWTQATAAAGFDPRYCFAAASANGKMIIAGGNTDGGCAIDAWQSINGVNWTRICTNIGSSYAGGGGTAIYNGEIYYISGGYNNEVIKTGCAADPTAVPTPVPTDVPTLVPTEVPTQVPTDVPTIVPTVVPTTAPTAALTLEPTPAVTVTDDDTCPHPNPAKDHVKISFNCHKKAHIKIHIYTFNGQLIDTVDLNTGWTPNDKLYQVKIDTRKYAPGMYFYTVQGKDDDGKLINYKSKKFLIKR